MWTDLEQTSHNIHPKYHIFGTLKEALRMQRFEDVHAVEGVCAWTAHVQPPLYEKHWGKYNFKLYRKILSYFRSINLIIWIQFVFHFSKEFENYSLFASIFVTEMFPVQYLLLANTR